MAVRDVNKRAYGEVKALVPHHSRRRADPHVSPAYARDVLVHVRRSWTGIPPAPPPHLRGIQFVESSRTPDWGLSGWRAKKQHVLDAAAAVAAGRGADVLVFAHVGGSLEAAAYLPRRNKLVAFDYLLHLGSQHRSHALRRCDGFLCIRSADIEVLRDLGVTKPAAFVPFPAPCFSLETEEGGYVYASGQAGRDWVTFASAVEGINAPIIVSTTADVRVSSGSILPLVTPDEGRRLTASASVVVVPFADVRTAAGPLVLLDAMALGKAIVVPDVAGSRDYVVDGESALVIPPGEQDAMRDAIVRLLADEALRSRLGEAARRAAASFTPERMWTEVARFLAGI